MKRHTADVAERRIDTPQRVERWFAANGVPAFVEDGTRSGWVRRWSAIASLSAAGLATVAMFLGARLDHALANVALVAGFAVAAGAITYVVIASGIVPIAVFAFVFFFDNLRTSRATMLSVLPLLLVAVTFFFLTTETWQTIGRLHGLPLVLTGLLFVGICFALVTRQVKPDLDAAGHFSNPGELTAALPSGLRFAESQVTQACDATADPLRRAERRNLLAVTAIAQLTVAAIVGLAVFGFFMVFGLFAVGTDVVTLWAGEPAVVWLHASIASHDYAVTSQHARVSTFLGVFSAFYFVVSASSNEAMRTSLNESAARHARTCLAVRTVYRNLPTWRITR